MFRVGPRLGKRTHTLGWKAADSTYTLVKGVRSVPIGGVTVVGHWRKFMLKNVVVKIALFVTCFTCSHWGQCAETVHLFLKANGRDIQEERARTSLGRQNSIECIAHNQKVAVVRERPECQPGGASMSPS
jgi:hypothetical protein